MEGRVEFFLPGGVAGRVSPCYWRGGRLGESIIRGGQCDQINCQCDQISCQCDQINCQCDQINCQCDQICCQCDQIDCQCDQMNG